MCIISCARCGIHLPDEMAAKEEAEFYCKFCWENKNQTIDFDMGEELPVKNLNN